MSIDFGKILPGLAPGLGRLFARPRKDSQAKPEPRRTEKTLDDGTDAQQTDAQQALRIAIRPTSSLRDEDQVLQDKGQFLARQDRWTDLADRVAKAEQDRLKTSSFMPVADLLLFGARADVVAAVEHFLAEGSPNDRNMLMDGIGSLEAVLHDHPDSYPIALTVALAHIDLGWAWHGSTKSRDVPQAHKATFSAHMGRASAILDRFCGIELNSPAVAAARCAVLAGTSAPHLRVADDYEDLIDLDPVDQRHMRAMGNHLLPRWFGSYDTLELEARRTASRTQDVWGNAGYAWVYFDAITHDPEACSRVDTDFFIDGLRDILSRRTDQATVNMLAAYCAIAMGESKDPASPRARISACVGWIIRDHLRELHPLVWAHAAQGFDNATRVGSVRAFADRGRDDALRVLTRLFADEIAEGHEIVFTADGPRILA